MRSPASQIASSHAKRTYDTKRFAIDSSPMAETTLSTLSAQVTTLSTQVSNFKNELDAFYLMWAGARVTAALAPPLSHQ